MPRDARHVLTEYLVLAAQGGDEAAFAQLHDLWSSDLRRFAAVKLGVGDGGDEVAQDAWIAIAKSLHQLDDPACFPRWALRVVERRCCDWLRRRRTAQTGLVPLTTEIAETAAAPAPHDGDDDGTTRLRAAIASLDHEARTLLHLFYEQGLSVAELAEVLDVPIGTAKSRLFTLRQTLRQSIERNPR
jgi:RNA polymerase sigma factor (sigma-70 family)